EWLGPDFLRVLAGLASMASCEPGPATRSCAGRLLNSPGPGRARPLPNLSHVADLQRSADQSAPRRPGGLTFADPNQLLRVSTQLQSDASYSRSPAVVAHCVRLLVPGQRLPQAI